MSGAEQNEHTVGRDMTWEEWLAQATQGSLWPWQQAAIEALSAGESWVATFPAGGGRGLVALLSAQLPGQTWLISHDRARLDRRARQAEAHDVPIHRWNEGALADDVAASLWLVHAGALTSEVLSALPEGTRLLLDAPAASAEPPAWWSSVPSHTSLGVMPAQHTPAGWWQQASERAPQRLDRSGWSDAIGNYLVKDTAKAPKAWREQENDGRTWWIGVSSDQADDAAYALDQCTDASTSLDAPTHVYFGISPANIRDLSLAAMRGESIWLQQGGEETAPSSVEQDEFSQQLLKQLEALAKDSQGFLYPNSTDLLTAMGQAITPQPALERNANLLHETLQALEQQGALHVLETCHFQVKIHSAQRFKEAFLKDDATLHQFWQHYQQMQAQLPPMQSLKLSLRNGLMLDLREFSKHLPYTVAELNQIIGQLIEKKLIIGSLEHVFPAGRFMHEYEIAIGRPQIISMGMKLWLRSQELRVGLLRAAAGHTPLSDALQQELIRFVQHAPSETAHWEALKALVGPEASEEDVVAIAGKALAMLDQAPGQHALLLWVCASQHIAIPRLEKATLRQAFPPPKQVPDAAKPMLKWLLDVDQDNFKHYVLDLKDPSGFESAMEDYLSNEAQRMLERNSNHKARGALHRYVRLANLWQETQSDDANPPAWAAAAGWATFLQGQKSAAWKWFSSLLGDAAAQENIVQWRMAQVAVGDKQWETAKSLLFPPPADSPLNEQQLSPLWRDLYHGLHQLCRKTAAGEACAHSGTPLYPADVEGITGLSEAYPNYPQAHILECLAKRLQEGGDLTQAETPALQLLKASELVKETKRLQRLIAAQLASRGEAAPEELEDLATWHDRAGRRDEAFALREALLATQPDNAHNLHRLAVASVYRDDMAKAFQWALEANRADPKRFPLERFVERNRERCFADTKKLRELLIELPAHPAFRAIEDELEALEALHKKLKPLQKQAEEAIEAKKFGAAKEIIKPILREHKNKAPAAFEALKAKIVEIEAGLLQRISHIPHRDNKKRNQHLEEVATEAKELGFPDIADEAYQKLVKFNPQYGLGFLKLARTASNSEQRRDAYQKAIDLSKNPKQRQRNLAEYIGSLEEEGKINEILPLLIEIAESFPEEIPKVVVPLMVKLVENLGSHKEIIQSIEDFLEKLDDPKPYKPVKQALGQMEELEPWKRALMAIKTN